MSEREKPTGLTNTERYLSRLSKVSFLSLWSHSNLFRSPGKELCDHLVVCGRYVIIFSDKEVKFDTTMDVGTAWGRWYNRAILKSAAQLKRARNWVISQPDRIFRDAKCEQKLKLFDRKSGDLEVHLIAVANGSSKACIQHFGGGSGSLMVSSSTDRVSPEPFTVGNPGGQDFFVHVFDEAHLHVVLQELDTITDFRDYLVARQRLITIDGLFSAAGEEDLLAVYLKDTDESGQHDFIWEDRKPIQSGQKIVVEEGAYRQYRKAGAYKRKKLADRESYLWDRLIEKFARNFTNGTLAPIPKVLGNDGREGGAELGLRYMALERRINRRSHAKAMLGAFDRLASARGNRFFRAMLPENPSQGETGFCILLMKREIAPPEASYEEYRTIRAATLRAYTWNTLERNRHLKRMIGLATEGVRSGRMSEDLIYHEAAEWSDQEVKNAKEQAEIFEIYRSDLAPERISVKEYPDTDLGLRGNFSAIPYRFVSGAALDVKPLERGNRKSRRAARARNRKNVVTE